MILHLLLTAVATLIEAVTCLALVAVVVRGVRERRRKRSRLPFGGRDLVAWLACNIPLLDGFGPWRRCRGWHEVRRRSVSLEGIVDVPTADGRYLKTWFLFTADPIAARPPVKTVR